MKDELAEALADVMKERRYVDDPSEAPEDVEVQEGPQGGLYYETDGASDEDVESAIQGVDGASDLEVREAINAVEFATDDEFDQMVSELEEATDEAVADAVAGMRPATDEDVAAAIKELEALEAQRESDDSGESGGLVSRVINFIRDFFSSDDAEGEGFEAQMSDAQMAFAQRSPELVSMLSHLNQRFGPRVASGFMRNASRTMDNIDPEQVNQAITLFLSDDGMPDVDIGLQKELEGRMLAEVVRQSTAVKGRRYIDDPSEAPEDAEVQEGEQGGLYYETDGSEQGQGEETDSLPSAVRIEPEPIDVDLVDEYDLAYGGKGRELVLEQLSEEYEAETLDTIDSALSDWDAFGYTHESMAPVWAVVSEITDRQVPEELQEEVEEFDADDREVEELRDALIDYSAICRETAKANYGDEMTVYRGFTEEIWDEYVQENEDGSVTVLPQAMESWTRDADFVEHSEFHRGVKAQMSTDDVLFLSELTLEFHARKYQESTMAGHGEYTIEPDNIVKQDPDAGLKPLPLNSLNWLREATEEEGETKEAVLKALEEKARRYIDDPSEAPDDSEVQEGPQGGLYYETEAGDADGEGSEAGGGWTPYVNEQGERGFLNTETGEFSEGAKNPPVEMLGEEPGPDNPLQEGDFVRLEYDGETHYGYVHADRGNGEMLVIDDRHRWDVPKHGFSEGDQLHGMMEVERIGQPDDNTVSPEEVTIESADDAAYVLDEMPNDGPERVVEALQSGSLSVDEAREAAAETWGMLSMGSEMFERGAVSETANGTVSLKSGMGGGGEEDQLRESFRERVDDDAANTVARAARGWEQGMYRDKKAAPLVQYAMNRTDNDTTPEYDHADVSAETDVSQAEIEAVEAISEYTTETLREAFGDEVTVFRGFARNPHQGTPSEGTTVVDQMEQAKESGEAVTIEHRPAESWSLNPDVAALYGAGGAVIKDTIPVEQIAMSSSVGYPDEAEEDTIVMHDGEQTYDPDQIILADETSDDEMKFNLRAEAIKEAN